MNIPLKTSAIVGKPAPKVQNGGPIGPIRALSALLERIGLGRLIGDTFDGNRNFYTVFGYATTLTSQMMYQKYRRQDVAKTIVNAPADALWTHPPVVKADEAFNTAWAALQGRFDVWDVLNRADKMTGFGRFSLINIGTKSGEGVERLLYMQPYSEMGVTVKEFDEKTSSPRFGMPTMYTIKPSETGKDSTNIKKTLSTKEFDLSWKNAVHIADGIVEDNIYGAPRLECCYNLLDDLIKIAGGSAETYWLTANRGMQLNIDKDMDLDNEDAEALAEEVDEYHHNLRRVLRTRGVEIKELGNKVADVSTTFQTTMALLSAAARIPQRILVGSEAGQLASEQDRANWAERVVERRKNFAEPHALTPLVAKLVQLKILPEPTGLQYIWPEAFILAPLEAAQTSAQKARSATNLANSRKTMNDIAIAQTAASAPSQGVDEFGKPIKGSPTKVVEPEELVSIDEARRIIGFGDTDELLADTNPNKTIAINSRRA